MNIVRVYKEWKHRMQTSDISKIKIESSGSFSMSSKHLFDDLDETKRYVKTLNKILKKK